jgi:hypothetical protein
MSGGFPLRCRSKRVIWVHATWQSLMSTPTRKMISMASLGSQQWDFARRLSTSEMGYSDGSDGQISSSDSYSGIRSLLNCSHDRHSNKRTGDVAGHRSLSVFEQAVEGLAGVVWGGCGAR